MIWQLICGKYMNKKPVTLHVPISILGNFNNHYVVYDNDGNVKYGETNIFSAIIRCRKENLYMTKIID